MSTSTPFLHAQEESNAEALDHAAKRNKGRAACRHDDLLALRGVGLDNLQDGGHDASDDDKGVEDVEPGAEEALRAEAQRGKRLS